MNKYDEELKYWIWLSSINGLSSKTIQRLLEQYKSPKKIWNLSEKEIKQIKDIKQKNIDKLLNKNSKINIDKYIEYMYKNNIQVITIKDKTYPKLLKNIYDPPQILYAKGNLDIINNLSIGVVGSRLCSDYGRIISEKYSYELAKHNITIISGLAKGIDTYAHIGCLKAKGKTIAVLGNGLDTIYPKENLRLSENILQNGGLILSEYIIGTKPEKYNFPARNRIISGLSKGILVVEAKEKSGALITADFGIEQGKDIFCIPGNIESQNSYGTNKLIQEGAKLVTKVEDILEEYFFKYRVND